MSLSAFERQAKTSALIVLAAGEGRRFEGGDKLGQDLFGRPLAHHILETSNQIEWGQKIAVTPADTQWAQAFKSDYFTMVHNSAPQMGLAHSLRLGGGVARDVSHLCVCLADMPFVTSAHLKALLEAADRFPERAIASTGRDYVGPPTVLPLDHMRRLPETGRAGARDHLADAVKVVAPDRSLMDVDTKDDLVRCGGHT